MKKQWYLLVYDIRDEKRLQKLHYRIKKEGIVLQHSVFLIHANQKKLNKITTIVKKQTATLADDVRLYPLCNPDVLWMAGCQQASLTGLYSAKPTAKKGLFHLFKNLIGGK